MKKMVEVKIEDSVLRINALASGGWLLRRKSSWPHIILNQDGTNHEYSEDDLDRTKSLFETHEKYFAAGFRGTESSSLKFVNYNTNAAIRHNRMIALYLAAGIQRDGVVICDMDDHRSVMLTLGWCPLEVSVSVDGLTVACCHESRIVILDNPLIS